MLEKIRIISLNDNRALIDERLLDSYLERGWKEGWPEDRDAKEIKEAADQFDVEKAAGDQEVSEATDVEDKPQEDAQKTDAESPEVGDGNSEVPEVPEVQEVPEVPVDPSRTESPEVK